MVEMKGKVLWFNPKLGYGFINNENIKEDIYVHFSNVECEGFKELYENDIVNFIYDAENKRALSVKVIRKSNKRPFYKKAMFYQNI